MSIQSCRVIHDILSLHCHDRPDAEAAVQGDRRCSFAALGELVDRRAKALLAMGVQRGDRVATLAPPSLGFWVDYLAATGIGAIWQGLNPRYQLPEYEYLLNDAEPRLVFVHSPYEERRYAEELVPTARDCVWVVRGEVPAGAHDDETFLARGDRISDEQLARARSAVEPEDIAVIVYTSGTTGKPKGAMLSHRAIVASARTNVEYFGEGLESTICAAPINHVGALNNVCMSVFAYGGRIVFYHRVDLVALAALTKTEQPTYLVASPTAFVMMHEAGQSGGEGALGSTRLLVFGGGVTPQVYLDPIAPHIEKMYNVFGQTECCGIGTATPHGASTVVMAETIGSALPGHELRVARSDDSECADGETGEIQLRGPICASGYWRNPEATEALFTQDGYLRTGDLGQRRPDGLVSYVGRLKEMYKSGGYNIYPAELEQVLSTHPEVLESVVMPVPHPKYQEVGFAFVVPKPGSSLEVSDLSEFMRARVANYKVPKHWSLEPTLPRLPNSKIDKQALRRRLETTG
jgi:acyl-CoA synthetase (AMP-forming)/AMP-acid ligase II